MPKDSPGRIPTLDGIRAVGIALVILGHSPNTRPLPDSVVFRSAGDLGVQLFFILSGFLITTLLMREHAKRGRISLGDFFVRRAFRIVPAFFAFLGVMGALALAGLIYLPWQEWVLAATYTMNFFTPETWWVGHLWSLAVEEQFYLIWPLTMVVVGPRRWIAAALVAIVVAPIARGVAVVVLGDIGDVQEHGFPFVFDALAMGCLLALVRTRLEASPRYLRVIHSYGHYAVMLALSAAHLLTQHRPILAAPTISLLNIAFAMWIHRLVLNPASRVGRVLETAPIIWIGTLSYSLYLWQQPFIDRKGDHWWTMFPVGLGFAVVCACASYYFVEQPVLRWRARRSAHARVGATPTPIG